MGKVNIVLENTSQEVTDYDLNLQAQDLISHIEALGKQLNTKEDPSHYCLRYKGTRKMVTMQDFNIPPGTSLVLGLSPKYESLVYINQLGGCGEDQDKIKTTIYYIKKKLEEESFAINFIQWNGIHVISSSLVFLQGNALAYCLQALEQVLTYQVGWESLSEENILFIVKIVDNVTEQTASPMKTNVTMYALRIITLVASQPSHGFTKINKAFQSNGIHFEDDNVLVTITLLTSQSCFIITAIKENRTPFSGLISSIGISTDLNIQVNALSLINTLLRSSPTLEARKEFLNTLLSLNIHKMLRRQSHIENKLFAEQRYYYQVERLETYNKIKQIAYDKSNKEHEDLLTRLWKAVFPDQELKARVSEQWKLMGFQGTDPATDFRGMGLLGLYNLIYIAENHPVIFRRIVKEQASREDNDYPVAVTGISITQLLFSIFGIGEKADGIGPIYNLLIDHDYAFEEIYCIVFQLLDRIWDEMNAAYMDFPKVLNAVKEKVSAELKLNDRLVHFQRSCSKVNPIEVKRNDAPVMQEILPFEGIDLHSLKIIARETRDEVMSMAVEQKKHFVKQGAVFKEFLKKGKHQANSYVYMICSADEKEIKWERIPEPNLIPDKLTNTIPLDDLAALLAGNSNPTFAKMKNVEKEVLTLGFSLQLRDGTSFDFISQSRSDFVNWTDGIRLLLGNSIENSESLDDIEFLCNADTNVKLLNLQGISVPSEIPPVPPPPSNFNFFTKDKDNSQYSS